MKQKTIISPEYAAFVGELKARIRAARISAARAVNQDLILLYWDIGRGILERQEKLGWGQSVVEMLARDLQKAFPGTRGFSPDNLWRMRQFFAVYGRTEFLEQVVPEIGTLPKPVHETRTRLLEQAVPELSESLGASRPGAAESRLLQLLASVPWGHHIEILKKVGEPQARLYYLRGSAQLGWSRNVLLNQIKAKAYERSLAEARVFVEQGWVGDFNELLAEALRRYLESHSARLAESFIREDVAWGLRGRE